jgi:hypothetical protein
MTKKENLKQTQSTSESTAEKTSKEETQKPMEQCEVIKLMIDAYSGRKRFISSEFS